ncbi:CDC7 protein kinase Hsk1 [Schizosaccharomyces cryophilus OY26]|uniref:non-specific serine/threonine protein kinase n=1 Tax=Schizosaccharomyces cryophilus (strain OY26 / ATCC MYA-4695 / CBS 11777 / NBRC 106824 / NRRL Y48691) TaxID=653667 RepID=S9W1V1_SCHCR|nr:CDC7 protein kinase Hsk1 [Schizosaccharomyces cryophilus OY26]EPY54033.1 CDC7 protein kinase Hsk1 [Schizosaccharomyces cryophilus OY26]
MSSLIAKQSANLDTSKQVADEIDECEATDIDEEGKSDNKEDKECMHNVPEQDREEMEEIISTFDGLENQYNLVEKIGEGTFSSVYKAEDLKYYDYINDWDIDSKARTKQPESETSNDRTEIGTMKREAKYVAIKKIYATSSPMRILNELEILYLLRGMDTIAPLITALRNEDQVLLVLPYYQHTDFRQFYSTFSYKDISVYFRCLFEALAACESLQIMHRDIKPSNFLFNVERKHGVLVDFGLAERCSRPLPNSCPCASRDSAEVARESYKDYEPALGYVKNDTRPSKRANRAGTRGFRAPEVLLKCPAQNTIIDVWSAGVILLSFLTKRFPMFNSKDDVDALMEIACIFGKNEMRQVAALHGCTFETNVNTLTEKRVNFRKLILWASCGSASIYKEKLMHKPSFEESLCLDFLERCLELDCNKRITACEAMAHDFMYLDDPTHQFSFQRETSFEKPETDSPMENDSTEMTQHFSRILKDEENEPSTQDMSVLKRKRPSVDNT